MDKVWKSIADKLPKQPCDDLANDITKDVYDEGALGESLILYHRQSVYQVDPWRELMTSEDIERRARAAKSRWGARCTCSNCGEDFIAGYASGKGHHGIVLFSGDDGQIYPGYAEVDDGGTQYLDGETLQCPFCYASGELTRRSELRHGRTYQCLQAEVINVDAYTVMMYWLVVDGTIYL